MYDELIKRLRTCAELHGECALCLYQGNGCDAMPETPLVQAADAIEELYSKDINSIPAVDAVEVVRGKWRFEKGDGKTCVDGWVCTNCNCGFHTNVPYFEEFNFCPNCGAKMEGEAK